MKKYIIAAALLSLAGNLAAQLSPAQREADFTTLASVFAKRYAPANWKIQALNVNLFEISPWIAKVRAAKTDLEFLEICSQYVSSLKDGHTQYIGPGNFIADLGFYADIYDDKILIDFIDRTLLPAARYPFQIGDEIVSIDGRPAKDIVDEYSKLHDYANPKLTRRIAADRLTYRVQSSIPSAGLLGESARVRILRQNGELEDYTVAWVQEGTPIKNFGALPGFFSRKEATPSRSMLAELNTESELPLWQQVHDKIKRWKLSGAADPFNRGQKLNPETGQLVPRRFILGSGSNSPVWNLPAGFATRQGRNSSDYFFTGTYMAEGKRIGYLRIGAFDSLTNAQSQTLDTEINFFNANTDGLIVDVMRNPGGTCSLVTIAQRLMKPGTFTHFTELYRPNRELIELYDEIISLLEVFGSPEYLVENYRFERGMLLSAYENGRGLTGPIPACTFDLNVATASNAYQKPLIVLADELSTSAADIFPAIIQDNGRAKIVGTRTGGLGGAVETNAQSAGHFSEGFTSNTISIVTRAKEYETPGFPKSAFIENVGVKPDIELDYMTRENLLQRGAPFVERITRIILDEIARGN
jgi:hypothetical protein